MTEIITETLKRNDSILVGCAIGERYEIMGRGMLKSFLKHNEGFDVKLWTGDEINEIIPTQFRRGIPFNKTEIGRWCALRHAIRQGYKHVLYCDNDIRFYAPFEFTKGHSLVMFPHVVTEEAKRYRKHFLVKDGIPNLGMIEVNVTDGDEGREQTQADEICSFVIDEVDHAPQMFTHLQIKKLWIQNFATYLPYCGYDAVYNEDFTHNVAHWNLGSGDRSVERILAGFDQFQVVCGNEKRAIKTFHFSNAGIRTLEKYGEAVTFMKSEYLSDLKNDGLIY